MKLAVVKGKKNHEGATERAMQSEPKYWVVSVCKVTEEMETVGPEMGRLVVVGSLRHH